MSEFYLQLLNAKDSPPWEKVDQYLYKNWQFALANDEKSQRYSGLRFAVTPDGIEMPKPIPLNVIGQIARLLDVKIPTDAYALINFNTK